MSKGYNKTIVIGRLAKAPGMVNSEKPYAEFTLSNNSISHDGTGEVQFHSIRAYNKQAALVMEHLSKGNLCCIEGELDTKKSTKDVKLRFNHTIIAERITFLSSKRSQD
jgi:single stranded DNA-binding protein